MGLLPAIDPLEASACLRWCYSARGNVVIYRDSDHLTAAYARTLTDWPRNASASEAGHRDRPGPVS